MVEAKWSGSYPTLCMGEWTLKVNGKNVSGLIPRKLRKSAMNTYGVYEEWHFEDWQEVFEDYEDGLGCEDWIKENKYWLDTITEDYDTQVEIYKAVNKHDWELIHVAFVDGGDYLDSYHCKVYRCKKCGYSKKYKSH